MSIQRCSERAFAMCPTHHLCGTRYEATFSDNSDCAEFNKKVDSMPMTNADRIRAMSDKELANFLSTKIANLENLRMGDSGYQPTATQLSALRHTLYCVWMDWLRRPAEDE